MYLPHLEELLKDLFKDSISNVYKNINILYRFSKVGFFFPNPILGFEGVDVLGFFDIIWQS